jgi:hypothetical protein
MTANIKASLLKNMIAFKKQALTLPAFNMKKNNIVTFDYSPIALRALTRHKCAPATIYFKDRKKEAAKKACR